MLPAFFVIVVPLILGCSRWVLAASRQDERGKSEPQFYDIYETIDTLSRHTPHHTFYELFGVAPDATNDEVSRAFRRTAMLYHPDKLKSSGGWNETTEQMSKVVQYGGTLLRTTEGRRMYDWVLNEAPVWHRQSVYVMKRFMPSSRLTINQVVLIVFIFSILLQLIIHWIGFATSWYLIITSRWEVQKMGEKEVKRMRKRLEAGDRAFLAMNNPNFHALVMAESPSPSLPNPLELWIFVLPLYLIRKIIAFFKHPKASSKHKQR